MKQREYRNNKVARPFSNEHAIHVTMRTKLAAPFSVRRTRSWLLRYVPELALKQGVRLYHASINSNHFHLVLRAPSSRALGNFLRVLAGVSARRVLGAQRGSPGAVGVWDKRPYSRVLSWGREFVSVMRYVQRNALETLGVIGYVGRETRLSDNTRSLINDSLKRARERRIAWFGLQQTLF